MFMGAWSFLEEDECWVCSHCGRSALNDWLGVSTPSKFCPHCGKPMILEETKDED